MQPGTPAAPPTPAPTTQSTQTQTQPTQPAQMQTPAEPPELAQARKLVADAEAKLSAAEKARRVHAAEARKFADEKKGLGPKLTEYEQLKKERAQAKLNKTAYLKSLYGDDWYDQIVSERVNGGAPTADTVALEMARMREEFEKKLEERDAHWAKSQAEAQASRAQAELRDFVNSAVDFAKDKSADYPLLETLGDAGAIGNALVQRIRVEHDKTTQRDEEGRVVRPGKILSWQEAADAIEAEMVGLAERAASHDKYRGRLTEKLKPATVNGVSQGAPKSSGSPAVPGAPVPAAHGAPVRRTLSNDLTASTPGRKPAISDAEARNRSIAAFNAVRGKAPA